MTRDPWSEGDGGAPGCPSLPLKRCSRGMAAPLSPDMRLVRYPSGLRLSLRWMAAQAAAVILMMLARSAKPKPLRMVVRTAMRSEVK